MKPHTSDFLPIRGLRYHVRRWGDAHDPKLFLLHGWMDVSASFQFLVDALRRPWHVIAPDWRGCGLSEWPQDGYWFPDYLGDLDAILQHYQPDAPVNVIGHSLGGNAACLYAGTRPGRVAKLITLEGFGLAPTQPEQAPERYAKWLDQLRQQPSFKPYASFADLSKRLQSVNHRLDDGQALFLAHCSAKLMESGGVQLLGDPRHKNVYPVLYRIEEALACWRRVTAPVLWVGGADSSILQRLQANRQDYERRKACFTRFEEVIVPEAGHMLHHDQPGRVARLIEAFCLDVDD
jgi:pimeloyl-ACP methyl ester carboxylesterase